MAMATKTTDHEEIRTWVEQRGGEPACVAGTGSDGDPGILRIDFPGYGEDEKLTHLSWDDWFQAFEEHDLAMLVQDETSEGKLSRFSRLVARDDDEEPQTLRRAQHAQQVAR
jgi:hypothetical protein